MNTPDHQMSQNCDTCPNHPARGCCTIRFCESEISISCCGSFWKPTGSGGCEMVLESIALAETAIAHILNAEGEKIQKILAICDDPQIILEVNRAVVQTITRVTQLEQTLLGKLQALEHYQKISTTPCDPCC